MSSRKTLTVCLILGFLVLSCGGTSTPAEMIVGYWEADNMGETRGLEFRADGTVLPEGEIAQHYEVIAGDPNILRISGMNGEGIIAELELTFSGEDRCTLSGMGITAELTRAD